MELNLYPIRPEEIVCMGGLSSRGLDQKIGCIGSLTANLNTGTQNLKAPGAAEHSDLTPRNLPMNSMR